MLVSQLYIPMKIEELETILLDAIRDSSDAFCFVQQHLYPKYVSHIYWNGGGNKRIIEAYGIK